MIPPLIPHNFQLQHETQALEQVGDSVTAMAASWLSASVAETTTCSHHSLLQLMPHLSSGGAATPPVSRGIHWGV